MIGHVNVVVTYLRCAVLSGQVTLLRADRFAIHAFAVYTVILSPTFSLIVLNTIVDTNTLLRRYALLAIPNKVFWTGASWLYVSSGTVDVWVRASPLTWDFLPLTTVFAN